MADDHEDYLSKSIKQFQRFVRQSAPAASAAYTLLGSVIFLTLIGYMADKYYNSSPIYILIGLVLGILIGFYELYKSIFKS